MALPPDRTVKAPEQPSELLLSPDEGSVEATGERGRSLDNLEQAVGSHRARLPLERQWPGQFDSDCVLDEPVCLLTEEDVARLRSLLEAGGNVDRIAGGIELAPGGIARDDLAGIHARSHL